MTTHSSILAWRVPWTEEPGGLQSMGLHGVRHAGSDLACMQTIGSLKARVNSCSSFTEYCFSDIFFYLFESAKLSKHA